MSNKPAGTVFHEGDEVVLGRGTYQGTPGVFVRLKRTSTGLISRSAMATSQPSRGLAGPLHVSQRVHSRTLGGRSQMNGSAEDNIEAWEGEGGAAAAPFVVSAISMSGTANQVGLGRANQAPGERGIRTVWRGHFNRLPVNRTIPRALTPKRLSQFSKRSALK